MKKIFIFTLIAVVFSNSPFAKTIYVKPGNTGTLDGTTPGTAFATINAAISAASPNGLAAGDEIRVAGGTLIEPNRAVIVFDNVALKGSYDAAFTAQNTSTTLTVINGQQLKSGVSFGNFTGCSIDGFKFLRCYADGNTVNGVANGTNGGGLNATLTSAPDKTFSVSRCQFDNCMAGTAATNGLGSALLLQSNAANTLHNFTVTDIVISSCTSTVAATPTTGSAACAAFYFQRTNGTPTLKIDRMVIKDCISANNNLCFVVSNSACFLQMSNILISNCRNTRTGATDLGIWHMRGRASLTAATTPVGPYATPQAGYICNMVIANCSAPNQLSQIDTGGAANDLAFFNNILYNNTVVPAGAAAIGLFEGGTGAAQGHFTHRNNIYFGNTGFTNIWDNGGTAEPLDASELSVDPKFVNALTDFHLLGTSPAINAGAASVALPNTVGVPPAAAPTIDLDNLPRPAGAGFEIGAYEVQGPPPPNSVSGWTLF